MGRFFGGAAAGAVRSGDSSSSNTMRHKVSTADAEDKPGDMQIATLEKAHHQGAGEALAADSASRTR